MKILCLCTGNTCRSPMLMTLLRHQLTKQGLTHVTVDSAGSNAAHGQAASALAVQTMAHMGLSLANHRSQPLMEVDIKSYDHILCMSSSHAAYARSLGIDAKHISVINAGHGGVPDPYGGSAEDYAHCAAILQHTAIEFTKALASASATTPPSHAVDPMVMNSAITAIAAVHATEPTQPSGKPNALTYAEHVNTWVLRLIPQPSDALRIAAHCQHLERWVIPRASFPMDKPGYFAWRKAVQRHQGERAKSILSHAGIPSELCERVATLVAKAASKGDLEAQALEDAACLTFLATELGDFASQHPDYTRDKFIDIIRKTWRKMSPDAHRLALTIPLAPALKALVVAAVS
jgi:protein-tyrosine-phosphatase